MIVQWVEFFFDLVSPYSYLAHGRVGRICEEHGAELVLRPMLLGGVHKAVGLQAPIEIEPKRRHQYRDIERWAEYHGLQFQFPDPFPFRTLKTMRAAVFSEESGDLEAFTREAFALYWERGGAPKGLEETDEDGPVAEVARRIGADPEEFSGALPRRRPRRRSRPRPRRRSSGGCSVRRPSSSAARCSGATTGCTSSKPRWTGVEGLGPEVLDLTLSSAGGVDRGDAADGWP
jgi:2-hydroxychromene-2-carboxylate isomerase